MNKETQPAPDYEVIRDFNELRVEPIEPVEMVEKRWYIPEAIQRFRIRREADQRAGGQFRRGRRG